MNRKGAIAQEAWKWIILGTIFIIVFFPIISRMFGVMQLQAEDAKCASSVSLASLSGGKGGIICPTGNLEIKSLHKDIEKRKQDVFDQILYSQYRCAGKFGFEKGIAKYNPFAFNGKACVICDNLVFDKDVKALGRQKGLLLRSAEKAIPMKHETFFEHFNGGPPTKEILSELEKLDDTIDFNEEHSVVFVIQTDYNKDNIVKGMTVGGAAGAAGATVLAPIISLIPGVNIGFWTVMGAGFVSAAVGGAAGSRVGPSYPAQVLVVPTRYAEFEKIGCKVLGNSYENPFEGDIE